MRGDHGGHLCQPTCSLQRKSDGEEALDHEIVEIASDPVAVGQQGEIRHLFVQSGVLDSDACCDC